MSIEKLDFQKVTKEALPYTLILTKVIQHIKHIDALAVWVYLCSLPPDWKVNKEHLKNHFHLGDRTLQAIFSYLNRSGLIEYKRERFETGTLGAVVVHVLCGDQFNPDEPYVLTTTQKTQVVELSTGSTTPQKTTRVANHTSGSEALQKKHNTNALDFKKETEKLSCSSGNERFSDFWKVYPRKQNRKKAEEAWRRQKLDIMADQIIGKVMEQVKNEPQWRDKKYIPLASSYLNAHRWEDEIIVQELKIQPQRNLPYRDESKCTIREWMPGNPDYDRVHSWKK